MRKVLPSFLFAMIFVAGGLIAIAVFGQSTRLNL